MFGKKVLKWNFALSCPYSLSQHTVCPLYLLYDLLVTVDTEKCTNYVLKNLLTRFCHWSTWCVCERDMLQLFQFFFISFQKPMGVLLQYYKMCAVLFIERSEDEKSTHWISLAAKNITEIILTWSVPKDEEVIFT